jgi:hypothetical protein
MAIARKPKGKSQRPGPVDVEALIRKGGGVAGEKGKNGVVPVLLRIPSEILDKVDLSVKARRIPTPRQTWILEAIVEKLGQELV